MAEPTTKFKPGDVDEPGTWRVWGKHTLITCPKCKNDGTLRTHKVADDGKVTPSVVCPHDGCDYHEYITLLEWKPL